MNKISLASTETPKQKDDSLKGDIIVLLILVFVLAVFFIFVVQ